MTRQSVLHLLTLLVVASSAATWVRCDDDFAAGKSEDDQWQQLERVRHTAVSASPEQLQKLSADANDGVAIRAAWEIARRRLAEDIAADPHNKDGILLKGADRFIGFVEGRLRVSVPQWWASQLALARATRLERPELFGSWDWDKDRLTQIGPRELSTAFGVVPSIVRNKSGELHIAWDKRKLRLSAKQIPNDPTCEDLTGLVYRDRCLVLGYDRDSFSWLNWVIYGVDPISSDVLWSSRRTFDARRTDGDPMGHTGASIHHVSLVGRDDVVFVFGMECKLVYIEAFRLSDGRPLMRFNSTY
jgi:hypothetical protein